MIPDTRTLELTARFFGVNNEVLVKPVTGLRVSNYYLEMILSQIIVRNTKVKPYNPSLTHSVYECPIMGVGVKG